MMQRASNNAYSWWYASHIRTKQSKWLDQSLQDMEEKVQDMLKLIEQEGDSFAKRAEMYYKRRPELINSVEESYRVFRALAERYDKLSRDLHSANHTIAIVFPEKIQMAMEDDDDFGSPRLSKNLQLNEPNSPKLPKPHRKDLKPINTKQFQFRKPSSSSSSSSFGAEESINSPLAIKSGLSKPEAVEEIEKLQEEICAMQTVKEYMRTAYETGLAKFQEIEKRILEMQQRVWKLQDEFGLSEVIENDKARDLMAETALKSCKQSLVELREKHEKCSKEAREESQKIAEADKKLRSLKTELLGDQALENESIKETGDQETEESKQSIDENKTGQQMSVNEMTIRIDELVNNVVNLEITVTSQTALIERMRIEADDLHAKIKKLEEEKANLTEDNQSLRNRVEELEEQLRRAQNLTRDSENQNENLRAELSEALLRVDDLSEKLNNVKPDDEVKEVDTEETKTEPSSSSVDGAEQGSPNAEVKHVTFGEPKTLGDETKPQTIEEEKEPQIVMFRQPEEFNWQKILLNGVEDKEKVLLKEYKTILKIYKDLKKKLDEKERDSKLEAALQMSDLKSAIAERDEEIQTLRRKLNLVPEEEKSSRLETVDDPARVSTVEEKIRAKIDSLMDENLEFWLKFSSSFNQIQRIRTTVKDLEEDLSRSKAKKSKSEMLAMHKHLTETNTEVTTWLEQSLVLKDKLDQRFLSLGKIQEEITQALKDDIKFGSNQAAKLHGEIMNMKQEHLKIREELQASVDNVSAIQQDVEETLKHLDHELGIFGNSTHSINSKAKVPLGELIFGNKLKKQRSSVFSCMKSSKKQHQVFGDHGASS